MREELLILASCLLRPMSRYSVLEEFRVRRFAVRLRPPVYYLLTTRRFMQSSITAQYGPQSLSGRNESRCQNNNVNVLSHNHRRVIGTMVKVTDQQ